jgi:hypothetical protein
MITKTLFSRHINKKQLNKQDVLIIEQDIEKFNKMKHRAVRLQNKNLTYKSMSGEEINFFCEFPYGQELIETALNLEKGERQAVCWSIEDWGNSFLVKCMINLKSERKNFCYTSGVIGIDVNADNISVAETDKSGNLLSHEVIDFNILNKSSEQIEQILSLSLERVYKIAEDRRKPVVMEKLEDIKQEYLYQGKRLNETLSMFAYSKITELALSKSNKYNQRI